MANDRSGRPTTAAAMARRIKNWADKGLDYALVLAAKSALAEDLAAARSRVPVKSGRLRDTIRITEPSAARTARKGFFRVSLAAGSNARGSATPQAQVLQTGQTYGTGARRSRPHVIGLKYVNGDHSARLKLADGSYRGVVFHPGSPWRKVEYLRVDEARVPQRIVTDAAQATQAALD